MDGRCGYNTYIMVGPFKLADVTSVAKLATQPLIRVQLRRRQKSNTPLETAFSSSRGFFAEKGVLDGGFQNPKSHPNRVEQIHDLATFIFLSKKRENLRFPVPDAYGIVMFCVSINQQAQFLKAEKNIKELCLSVDLMKNESKKLLQRAAFAEDEMKKGYTKLKDAGNEIQRLSKTVYKIESEAADLMDGLRAIPGREAIKLRAEVASMASIAKQQRTALDKRILKISELGISV